MTFRQLLDKMQLVADNVSDEVLDRRIKKLIVRTGVPGDDDDAEEFALSLDAYQDPGDEMEWSRQRKPTTGPS